MSFFLSTSMSVALAAGGAYVTPPEIAGFRSDHGRDAAGVMVADQSCLICHGFGEVKPKIDTYVHLAPNCQTCHPPEANPRLSGGAPVLRATDLLPASTVVKHSAPYPGFGVAARKSFAGFFQTIASYLGSGKVSNGELTVAVRTGASYRLPKGDKLGARVYTAGTATVTPDGKVTPDLETIPLTEAAISYQTRNKNVAMEAGLLKPPTLLGRFSFLGLNASFLPSREVMIKGFLGRLFNAKTADMIYGLGAQATKKGAPGMLTAGIEMLGSGDQAPRVAVNGGAFASGSPTSPRASITNKTILDPANPYMALTSTETSGLFSPVPWLDVSATHLYRPALSDNPLSGLPANGMQTVYAGANLRLPYVAVDYTHAVGTYLISEDKVVVVFDVGRNVDVTLSGQHQDQLFITDKKQTTRVGAAVDMTLRNFQAHVGYTGVFGGDIPMFEGLPAGSQWVDLRGSYLIADRVTVAGQVMLNVEDPGRSSGGLVVTIPLGSGASSVAGDFAQAQSIFENLADRDPLLSAFVNSAIYPSQEIPETNMPHDVKVRLGIPCVKCHDEALDNGQMGMPTAEVCVTCHHTRPDFKGRRIIPVWDPSKMHIDPSFTNYDHRISGHVPAGPTPSNVCMSCHTKMGEVKLGTVDNLPTMRICKSCHDKGVSSDKIAEHGLENDCQLCHVSDPVTGRLVTLTPYGSFYARNHGARQTMARAVWWKDHGPIGQTQAEFCEACHGTEGGSTCVDCHSKMPSSHTPDWKQRHPVEWLNGKNSCSACHVPSDLSDEMSLCRDCHDDRLDQSQLKHAVDWRYDCRDEAPTNYHQFNALAGARFCFACHEPEYHEEEERKAIGCSACHGTGNLGTCDHN